MTDQTTISEPGVYFGLDADTYHSSLGLSSSGIKDLRVSPLTYWANHLDPDREERETDATSFGRAAHVRILEGPDVFYSHYAAMPDIADYPDALDSADDLKARCKELELPVSGTKAELCARILEADSDAVLWPVIMAAFLAANKDVLLLKPDAHNDIERRATLVDAHPDAGRAFSGGHPEVSIFWDDPETGIRMKCRIDYLKMKASIDLKTFTNQMSMPVDVAIARAVANYKYHAQGCFYMRGVEAAKELVGAEQIFGPAPDPEWLVNFASCDEHAFYFVFVESGNAPNIRVRRLTQHTGGVTNAYWFAAEGIIHDSINTYMENVEKYGLEVPWHDNRASTPFQDEEFPLYMID